MGLHSELQPAYYLPIVRRPGTDESWISLRAFPSNRRRECCQAPAGFVDGHGQTSPQALAALPPCQWDSTGAGLVSLTSGGHQTGRTDGDRVRLPSAARTLLFAPAPSFTGNIGKGILYSNSTAGGF